MRDDNVEVLSFAVDREFHGAQVLLKEHMFGSTHSSMSSCSLTFFHFATQTARKLLPSSLPGVDRRLRGVENVDRSLSHSRYHCSVLLRSDRLLTLFITGGFRTLAF